LIADWGLRIGRQTTRNFFVPAHPRFLIRNPQSKPACHTK
jgi:hypothetical protein